MTQIGQSHSSDTLQPKCNLPCFMRKWRLFVHQEKMTTLVVMRKNDCENDCKKMTTSVVRETAGYMKNCISIWAVTRAQEAAFEATRRWAAAVSKSPNGFLSVNCEWNEALISYWHCYCDIRDRGDGFRQSSQETDWDSLGGCDLRPIATA